MFTTELTTTNLSEFMNLTTDVVDNQPFIYRGQANYNWKLIPSIYRISIPKNREKEPAHLYDCAEAKLVQQFFDSGLPYLSNIERGYGSDRIRAQHFGVPTRLLDWSFDPLVALFFAVENWRDDRDSSVYILCPDTKLHYQDMTRELVERYQESFPETKPFTPNSHNIAIIPPAIDQRVLNQKSVLTLHSFGQKAEFEALEERSTTGAIVSTEEGNSQRVFCKIRIAASNKRGLFCRLLDLGVDRRRLFPTLDGLGSDIATRAEINRLS